MPPPPTAVCTVRRARLQPRGVSPEHPKGSHPRGKKARAELSGKSQRWPSRRENSEKMRAAALTCEMLAKTGFFRGPGCGFPWTFYNLFNGDSRIHFENGSEKWHLGFGRPPCRQETAGIPPGAGYIWSVTF